MLLRDTVQTATKAIKANKSRSLLTMLGIIIGVGSVVLMTGVGKSMEGVILGQISILGPESMVIFPGMGPGGGAPTARTGFDSLTQTDVDALHDLTTIQSIAPFNFLPGFVSYGREETEPQVLGTNPNYFTNLKINLDRGRLFDWTDEKAARFVAVLGPDTVTDLFLNKDPLGKRIKMGGRTYTVIGVLKPVGTAFFTNLDERVYIPLSTSQAVTGQSYYSGISMRHTGNADLATADVESLLRQTHKIDNPEGDSDKDDFGVRNSGQAQEIFGSVSIGLTAFITSIAAISLIVGGIGIMNIMLVAVTERTKEIGLRKALGATRKDVLTQFLIEAILLTLIGGLIGIALGIACSLIVALALNVFLSDYLFAISIPSIAVAVFMAAVTGLVFGMYPARKASLLSPMEALRYE